MRNQVDGRGESSLGSLLSLLKAVPCGSRLSKYALLVVPIVVSYGCGTRPNIAEEELSSPGVPVLSDAQDRRAPGLDLASITLSEEELDQEYLAWQLVMQDCMNRRGFEFEIFPRPTSTPPRLVDEPGAAMYGFRAPPDSDGPIEVNANDERAERDEAFSDALFGSDRASGCKAASLETLRVSTGPYAALATEAQQQLAAVADVAMEDATMDDVNRRWSACMADRGHSYDTRQEPIDQFSPQGGELTQHEVDVRADDLQCAADVGWWTVRDLAMETAQQDWSRRNVGLLAQLQETHSTYLASLQELIDRYS